MAIFGLDPVRERIRNAARTAGRDPGSVALVAVSKARTPDAILELAAGGQRAFGENYLQEALPKIRLLSGYLLEWHFIGRVQTNKAEDIASNFAWVHTVDRERVAERLNAGRADFLPRLNVCIQVNVSGEVSKGGVALDVLPGLVQRVMDYPRLMLRGLMALPPPEPDPARQRAAFAPLMEAIQGLNAQGLGLDTLSIGTSDDLEAAIAEGATLVRIGTALFGPRPP
ncbi:MAG: YggS family pyridoxal phosphate-dependent enzyme [Gammaproteobacteria bacterium]